MTIHCSLEPIPQRRLTGAALAAAVLLATPTASAHWEADDNRHNPPLETVVQVDRLDYSEYSDSLNDPFSFNEAELLTIVTVTWGPGHEHEAREIPLSFDHEFEGDEVYTAISVPITVASHRECSPYSGEPTFTARSFEIDEGSLVADILAGAIGGVVGVAAGVITTIGTSPSGPAAPGFGVYAGAAIGGGLGVLVSKAVDSANGNDAIETFVNRGPRVPGYFGGPLAYADITVSSSVTVSLDAENSACAPQSQTPFVIPGPATFDEEDPEDLGGDDGGDEGGIEDTDAGSSAPLESALAPRPAGIDHLLRSEAPMVTTSDEYFEERADMLWDAADAAPSAVESQHLRNRAEFGFDDYHPLGRNTCVSGLYYERLGDAWTKAEAAADDSSLQSLESLARDGDVVLAFAYAPAHRMWVEASARAVDAELLADVQDAFSSAMLYASIGSVASALDEYRWIHDALSEHMYPEFQSVDACATVLVDAGIVEPTPELIPFEPVPFEPVAPFVPLEPVGPLEPIGPIGPIAPFGPWQPLFG